VPTRKSALFLYSKSCLTDFLSTFAAPNQNILMFKQTKTQQRIIRFRRWSRARYAVFCSLGTVVTIGCLAVSIADKSVQKSANVNTLSVSLSVNEFVDNESVDLENDGEFLLTETINLTSVATDEVAAKSINLNIHQNG